MKWYRKSAEQGDATAQYNLACCYKGGGGVEQSEVKAVEWFRRAAERGNVDAQNKLGVCYANGEGVEKSVKKAMYWFRKAQKNGANLSDDVLRYMKRNKGE